MRSILALTIALAVVGVTSVTADAQPSPRQVLEMIREHILHARYDEAIANAESLLNRAALPAAQRNQGLELLATAHIANRDVDNATPVLQELYARDPGHRIDSDASPPVQAAFQRAREAAPPPIAVRIEHEPPEVSAHESPAIDVRVSAGSDAVHELRVLYRTQGAPRYAALVLELDEQDRAGGRLPLLGEQDAAQRIEYYLEAKAPSGSLLGSLGSDTNPLEVEVPPRPAEGFGPGDEAPPQPQDEGGVATKWWFWTILVVVAAGAAVGLYVALGPPSQSPEGSLGSLNLP